MQISKLSAMDLERVINIASLWPSIGPTDLPYTMPKRYIQVNEILMFKHINKNIVFLINL